jgi:hypothetical protein
MTIGTGWRAGDLHMRRLVVAIVVWHTAACGPSQFSAQMTAPGGELAIAVSIAGSHAFLAEYDRTLITRRADRELARIQLPRDTGGYALVNMYAVNPDEILVSTHFGSEYVVHLQTGAIAESTTPRPRPNTARAEAIFLGAFDFGSEKRWQFIPASTRAERTVQ